MKKEEMKFEDKMAKLEELVSLLEKDDVKIDESIELYKEAMKLVSDCNKQLKGIEEQISKMVDENGNLIDFEVEAN